MTLALNGYRAHAEGLLEPMAAINEGQLAISDGSSVYIFNKDKTFRSGPLGLSGRTIRGTWNLERDGFRVIGTWGWINGLSNEDERTMLINIGSVSDELQEMKVPFYGKRGMLKIRKAYFIIQTLEKVKANHSLDRPAAR